MEIPFYKCNGNGNTFIILVNNNIDPNSISKLQIQKYVKLMII